MLEKYYADTAQKETLKKIKKQLDEGKLKEVRDTADFWRQFTTVELHFILNYLGKKK